MKTDTDRGKGEARAYRLLELRKPLTYWKTFNAQSSSTKDFQLFFSWLDSPTAPRPPHCRGFTISLRNTTLVTSLDGWSATGRYLYLTTHNTRKTDISCPPEGFGPAVPTSERPQADALDHAGTGKNLQCGSANYLLLQRTINTNWFLKLCEINQTKIDPGLT